MILLRTLICCCLVCSDPPLSLVAFIQELEKALSEQDLDFLRDLIACLLQGCYQRNDIT